MVDADHESFRKWIEDLHTAMENIVTVAPAQFKCSSTRSPAFENVIIQPSLNQSLYGDKIVFRLATQRTGPDINDQKVIAVFVDNQGEEVPPAMIKRGGTVVPIIKVCYYKGFMDTYSMQMFVLKGLYTAPPDSTIDNRDWQFDQ